MSTPEPKRGSRRRRRFPIHFSNVKNGLALPLHVVLQVLQPMPFPLKRAAGHVMLLPVYLWYFMPGSHVRTVTQAMAKLCRHAGHQRTGLGIFLGLMDRLVCANLLFSAVLRQGDRFAASKVTLDEDCLRHYPEALERGRGAVLPIPHCAGALFAAAGLAGRYDLLLLVRESRDARRRELMVRHTDRLGADIFYIRLLTPIQVTRGILRGLRGGKLVPAMTDPLQEDPGEITVTIFGQEVLLAGWPARMAKRCGAPILPGFATMRGERITVHCADPIAADDVEAATQSWASTFEAWFLEHPEEWTFLFHKAWARIVREAARRVA